MEKKFYRLMQIKLVSHATLERSRINHTHRNLWDQNHWKKTDDKLLFLEVSKTKENPYNRNLICLMKSFELWEKRFP